MEPLPCGGAARQPATPAEIVAEAGLDERYVTEWLRGQAAGGYVEYDAATGRFALTPAQWACLADPDSPTCLPGAFQVVRSVYLDVDRVETRLPHGAGLGWHEHHADLFEGTERFFRPGYAANLVSGWIPALVGASNGTRVQCVCAAGLTEGKIAWQHQVQVWDS